MPPDSSSLGQSVPGRAGVARLVDAIVAEGGKVPLAWRQHVFSLPVQEALDIFAQAAPRVPPWPDALRYGREVIGVPEARLDSWFADAWWGSFAANACGNRLSAPRREQEVMDLVEPVDWSPLEQLLAEGRGVLLCTSHSGVPYIITSLLVRAGRPVMQVGVWNRHRLNDPQADFSHAGQQAGFTRVYLQAFTRLRAGGIAKILPDGKYWREAIDERFLGHPCKVSLAAATLARLSGAPALRACALWNGRRIRIEFAAAMEPGGGDHDTADRHWMRAYLDWLEGVVRANPRAIRFDQLLPQVTLPEAADVAG